LASPAHSDHAHIAIAHAVKLIQDAGYKVIILYEAEIYHKRIGKKKKGRPSLGLCAFEVHGPEHSSAKQGATCNSDTLKQAYSRKKRDRGAGQPVPLRDRLVGAAIVGAAVNRAYSTQV
jgi:hypothetical protein